MRFGLYPQPCLLLLMLGCAPEHRTAGAADKPGNTDERITADPNALANSYEDYRAGRGRNYIMTGDTIRLRDRDDSVLVVARRADAEGYGLITNGPLLKELPGASEGRYFWVPPNTIAIILHLEDPGPYMKVRTTEGPARKRTGWVAAGRWSWRDREQS
jgi:hypothetical protein